MTAFNAVNCLKYNPFDGDFGAPGDKVLKDKIGVARKQGPCHLCAGTIQPGEQVRMRSDVYDGALLSFRWCQSCCSAMAKSWRDDGAALDARYALRRA